MKIELETKNKIMGIEIDVNYFKYKFKKFVKNLLGALSIISLCLLCSIEIKPEVSFTTTVLIYSGLMSLFILGMIIDNK